MGNRLLMPVLLCSSLIAMGAAPSPTMAQSPDEPLVEVIDITVESVTVEDGELIANAVVTLDVVGRTITREVQIPLEVGGSPGAEGECDVLNLALGPVNLDLLGLVVNLDDCEGGPVTVDITADAEGGLLGDLLCGIAGLLDSGVPLDTILDELTDEELELLTGAIEDVLNAILDEVLMANVLSDQVAAQSHQNGTDILQLEIPEGVHLDLLGLQVDTSGICLHVHAERGSGNLLGTLLSNVARLLDRGNDRAAQAQIRVIQRLLDRPRLLDLLLGR